MKILFSSELVSISYEDIMFETIVLIWHESVVIECDTKDFSKPEKIGLLFLNDLLKEFFITKTNENHICRWEKF